MKCNICRTELEPDYHYSLTLCLVNNQMHEVAYDATIYICDNCEQDLMRMYRELREDVADHI